MSRPAYLAELNAEQYAAVTTTAQNCLVLAGAGSGKTKTIVARAAYLIAQGIPAQNILILTFTRRAASEIVARVQQALGDQAKGLRASTFHTFCLYLLRRAPKTFGLNQFSIIDRDDQLLLFRLLRGKDSQGHLPKAKALCDLYSFARNTQRKLSDALALQLPEAVAFKDEIAEIMRQYQARKQARQYLDYDDLLAIVAGQFQHSAQVVNWFKQQCSALLIDEMQDTNPLQWALLQPLIGQIELFCVGDDAQSIYAFRGADFENIHQFAERVPNAQVLQLARNYRSTQEILDFSNWLLASSPIAYNKQLQAARGAGQAPQLHIFAHETAEANWLADDLKQRHHAGAAWSEHLVLLRSSYSARHVERALIAADIPYLFTGGVKLLESAHVKDLLSMLRVVVNPLDDLGWMRFLTLWNGVGDVGAAKLSAELMAMPDWDARCARLERHGKVSDLALLIFKQLDVLREQAEACIGLAFEALKDQLAENYQNQQWSRREQDFALVKQLAQKHLDLAEFLEAYVLEPISIADVQAQNNNDVVHLMTIHAAKGAEKPVCYVPHVAPNYYPHARAQGDFDQIEEERRVLYVALTRAQNELILTRHNFQTWSMPTVDTQGRTLASYFLNDVPTDLLDTRIHTEVEQTYATSASVSRQRVWTFDLDLD